MSFEDIGSVEALLRWRSRPGTKATDHGSLVVGQGVSIFVVLSCKALLVVFTSQDGTFLGTFGLMCEHVGLQVFEDFAALGMRASSLFPTFLIQLGHWA